MMRRAFAIVGLARTAGMPAIDGPPPWLGLDPFYAMHVCADGIPLIASGGRGGAARIDYRPVHEYALTDDVSDIEPKKRVH